MTTWSSAAWAKSAPARRDRPSLGPTHEPRSRSPKLAPGPASPAADPDRRPGRRCLPERLPQLAHPRARPASQLAGLPAWELEVEFPRQVIEDPLRPGGDRMTGLLPLRNLPRRPRPRRSLRLHRHLHRLIAAPPTEPTVASDGCPSHDLALW